MGYALVSAGAVASSLSPSFGASTAAGNLLVAWLYANSGAATDPFTVSGVTGWAEVGAENGPYGSMWTGLWYKADCGSGETAPSFAATGSPTVTFAMLAEFSGGATSSPLDQSGVVNSGSGTVNPACGAADGQGGDLIVACLGWNGGASTTISNSMTDGTGASVTVTAYSNGTSNSGQVYDFAWGVAGGHGASADTATGTVNASNGGSGVIASFKPAASPGVIPGRSLVVSQAVKRAAFY